MVFYPVNGKKLVFVFLYYPCYVLVQFVFLILANDPFPEPNGKNCMDVNLRIRIRHA
jgi:hypothetical protein